MEAAPAGVDVEGLGAAVCAVNGVRSVHDLHVWTVTAGFGAIAAHVVVAPGADRDLVRRRLEVLLAERFGIDHTTLQMEEEAEEGLLRVENVRPIMVFHSSDPGEGTFWTQHGRLGWFVRPTPIFSAPFRAPC